MRTRLYVDITQCDFDKFVDFLFAPVVQPESARRDRWYFNTRVSFDPNRVCGYYVHLFRNAGFLLERYSRGQLEQGFGAIQVRSLCCSVRQIMWHRDLPFSDREECVRSIFHFCRDIFRHDAFEFTASMWWDSFCFDWECGNRRRSRGGEDLLMQDVLFGTLSRVLLIDSSICRGSALHGLEHLHHPETMVLIGGVIQSHPELAEQLTGYADVIRGRDPLWMRSAKPGD